LEATYRVIPDWNHDDTSAPWWRLYWNDRPGWVARYRGEAHELGPNRVVLIAPESNFVARSARAAGHLWIHFNVGPPLHALRGAVFELQRGRMLRAAVDACREALLGGDDVRTGLRAPALCALALSRLEALPTASSDRTRKLLSLMHAQASRPGTTLPKNQALARAVSMHPNAFVRWFKRELGTTPRAYMLARRIEQACALLRHTQLSVEAIGERLGFCDRYHFSRSFRRVRGLSPAAFRRGGI
jgi:AraC-like DNA-binding protein